MRLSPNLKTVPAGALLVESSADSKLTRTMGVAATLVAQDSCPVDCPFLQSEEDRRSGKVGACYANSGNMGVHSYRLNATGPHDAIALAQAEADLIRRSPAIKPLRLHAVGDCPTDAAAQIVSDAAGVYRARHGMSVWTYTHASDVKRASWGDVSVLRSCHTPAQIARADAEGFAVALVVPFFPEGPRKWREGEFTLQPCPAQLTKKVSCDTCRLCWDDEKLRKEKKVIAFAEHGTGVKVPAARARYTARLESYTAEPHLAPLTEKGDL